MITSIVMEPEHSPQKTTDYSHRFAGNGVLDWRGLIWVRGFIWRGYINLLEPAFNMNLGLQKLLAVASSVASLGLKLVEWIA